MTTASSSRPQRPHGSVVHDGAVSGVQQVLRAQIVDDAPSVDAVLAEVRRPAAGAVALFVGVVRDHDAGREGVIRLDYSAHPDAEAQLGVVAEEVAGMPGVQGVVVVHRRGELGVGDTAVVCAVSAAHRAEAFAACRTLIEELKSRVPIWKKQLFEGGSTEWVGL